MQTMELKIVVFTIFIFLCILGNNSFANSCDLVPVVSTAGDDIAGLAGSGKQLVTIDVQVTGNGSEIVKEYHLDHWVIPTSLTGQSILMLKEYFDPMSLYTLGLGVESYTVVLNETSSGCLAAKQKEEIATILRNNFLTSFGSSSAFPSNADICNRNIGKEEANRDRLIYTCCKYDLDNQLQCSELSRSIWIKLLFISILIVQVLIILYSPAYMPDFMYKARSIYQNYAYTMDSDKFFDMRVKIVTDSANIDPGFRKANLHEFTHLTKFKDKLESATSGEVHNLKVSGVDMCVRDSKIVSEGNAPVGFLSFLKDFFVHCNMRHDIPEVRDCCNQDMWVKIPCSVIFRWYQCLSGVMMFVFAALLASPWLLRIWFYYAIEEDIIENQKTIYEKYDTKMPYPGNLVTYLSPMHPFFLFIHMLFAVEIVFYIILPGEVKEKVKYTVRQCFRDTRDKSKHNACGSLIALMIRPLKLYGIVGCVVLPLWLIVFPFFCVLVILEVVPVANLTVRVLVNLVFYIFKVINPNNFRDSKQREPGKVSTWMQNRFNEIIVKNENEPNTRLNKCLHTLALIMTFISLWLFLILVAECIAFYVECVVYALIGFILNPWNIYKYVSLVLLVVIYGIDCFSGVHSRYAAYGTGINSEVQGMVGDKMTEEASKSGEEQQNTAFRVPARNYAPERMCLVMGSNGYLMWKVSRLILLLDKSDIPYIPSSFLFKMAQLNHFQCPGLVHLLYFKAFVDFFVILLFLVFVFIVIFAFGQADDISSTAQAIAALATGFFPLILKKCLFQSQTYTLDRENLNWKTMFANAVQRYSEKWNFEDITIAETDVIEMKPITNASVTVNNENGPVDIDTAIEESERNTEMEVSIEDVDKHGDTIDLIVKRGKNVEGEEFMTFYAHDNEMDYIYVDAETMI